MTQQQARKIFDQAIAAADDADKKAKLELAREFFTNTSFRKGLQDYVWAINNAH